MQRGSANPLPPPQSSADENPLPWLVRRLDASIDDAAAAGTAAREALVSSLAPSAASCCQARLARVRTPSFIRCGTVRG